MNATELDETDAEALLDHFARGPRVAVSTAFGPSGVVLLHLLEGLQIRPRIYFLDTRQHFPETLQVLERWRERGFAIDTPTPGLEPELAAGDGKLWLRDPDRCCHLRKVLPNARALANADTWIVGLRRDQTGRAGLTVQKRVTLPGGHALTKVAPLATWTRERVWQHIHTNDLPYNPLFDQGYRSVGCAPCTRPVAHGHERAGRWIGRTKTECGLHLES